ncbi:hypothetical protein A3J03_01680, partial [Candidatus Uhrbacteria bacterium RIFCSPLOWO2_02_FULL_46_25]
ASFIHLGPCRWSYPAACRGVVDCGYMVIIQAGYLFLLALALAFLEVQIEGAHGWAVNLPCWRPKGGRWYSWLYTKVMGGKELTGYHLGVFSFAFLVLHLPYIWGVPWGIGPELQTLSLFFLFIVLWDFLWFIINPHYGIRKFRPNCISWHKIWIARVPIDYYGGVLISLTLRAFAVYRGYIPDFRSWFFVVGVFVDLLLITVLVVEGVKRVRVK